MSRQRHKKNRAERCTVKKEFADVNVDPFDVIDSDAGVLLEEREDILEETSRLNERLRVIDEALREIKTKVQDAAKKINDTMQDQNEEYDPFVVF